MNLLSALQKSPQQAQQSGSLDKSMAAQCSKIYKQAAMQKLNKSTFAQSANTSLSESSITQSTKFTSKFVSFLIPLVALREEQDDAPITECFAKSFQLKLKLNEDTEIQEKMSEFMHKMCTEQAIQDSDLINNIFNQLKENYQSQQSVPRYVRHKNGKIELPKPVLPTGFTPASKVYDQQIQGFLNRGLDQQEVEYSYQPEINSDYVFKSEYQFSAGSQKHPVQSPSLEETNKQFKASQKTSSTALEYRKKQVQKLKKELIEKFQAEKKAAQQYADDERKRIMDEEKREADAALAHKKAKKKPGAEPGPAEPDFVATEVVVEPMKIRDFDFATLNINEENPTFDDIQQLLNLKQSHSVFDYKTNQYFTKKALAATDEKDRAECTFNPVISEDAKQKEFEEKDVQRRLLLLERISAEKIRKHGIDLEIKRKANATFQPIVSEKSTQIANKVIKQKNVYKRLTDHAKVQQYIKQNIDKIYQNQLDQNCTFQPNIDDSQKHLQLAKSKQERDLFQQLVQSQNSKESSKVEFVGTEQFLSQFSGTFRSPQQIKKQNKQENDQKAEVYDRLFNEGNLMAEKRQYYEQWGESLAVLMANTVHTSKRSGLVLKFQQEAMRIYQTITGTQSEVTGADILNNLNKFDDQIRDKIQEFAEFCKEEFISEKEFVRVYLAYK